VITLPPDAGGELRPLDRERRQHIVVAAAAARASRGSDQPADVRDRRREQVAARRRREQVAALRRPP
jgi:hypothetical protein